MSGLQKEQAASNQAAINVALCQSEMAAAAASFANDNIYPIMNALQELADVSGLSDDAAKRRMVQVAALAKVGRHLLDDMVTHFESEQDEAQEMLTMLKAGAA